MSEPTSRALQTAAAAAERLIGFYPAIQASDPKVYAAGLVKMFASYLEALVNAAVDPVHGLPAAKRIPAVAGEGEGVSRAALSRTSGASGARGARETQTPSPAGAR